VGHVHKYRLNIDLPIELKAMNSNCCLVVKMLIATAVKIYGSSRNWFGLDGSVGDVSNAGVCCR